MTDSTNISREPAQHYDTVVEAWGYLLKEDLHYGYFDTGEEKLVEATDNLTGEMLKLANLSKGNRVLDVGCGTGKAGCRIAQEFDCEVIGISPSNVCVTSAAEKAAELGLESLVRFQIGDGTNMDFEDASFDCTWVMESSHLMPDKEALISECARVLKPGGTLILCDIMLDHKLRLEEVIASRDKFLLLKDVFGRAIMEPLDFYDQQCAANNLQTVHKRNISAETLLTFDHWYENAENNRDEVSAIIGEHARQQFADSCGVLREFWERKILGYGIFSACKPT